MDEQRQIAEFIETHDLDTKPAYHLLDLVSEVGEISKEMNESTSYGREPGEIAVAQDELGDALFSLLAVCDSLDIDAGAALDEALEKYDRRLEKRDTPGSGS